MKLLNEKYRIVAVERELLPEQFRGWVSLMYLPTVDMIAVNDDCAFLETVVEFMATYLSWTEADRKKASAWLDCSALQGLIDALDQIEALRNNNKKTA